MIKNVSLIIFLFVFMLSNAQENYKILWEKVEKFELQGLPQSALQIVDSIFNLAEQKNNSPQIVKSLIFKSKFALVLEEKAKKNIIHQFENRITKSSFPEKNVLQSLLASIYKDYHSRYSWKINQRTSVKGANESDDISTWNTKQFFDKIHQLYQSSLSNDSLLYQTPIYEYGEIISLKQGSKRFRPTLLDLLSHNALTFYERPNYNFKKFSIGLDIDEEKLFFNSEEFLTIKIPKFAEFSFAFETFQIYRNLMSFHNKNNARTPLTDIDILRLQFVHQFVNLENKKELLVKAYEKGIQENKKHASSTLYSYELATIFSGLANDRNREKKNRFKNQDALKICESAINRFEKSAGARRCKELIKAIKTKSLKILTENFIPIQKNSRILINYKNIDTLSFSIYRIDNSFFDDFNYMLNRKNKIKLIKKLKNPAYQWTSILRNEKDYLEHSTEVIVPKMEQGQYIIVTHPKKVFDEEMIFGINDFQVTNLAIVQTSNNDTFRYQFIDRYTSTPLKGVKVRITRNSKKKKNITRKYTSDKNGFINYKYKSSWSNDLEVSANYKGDNAHFEEIYESRYNSNYDEEEEDEQIVIKPFVFTDRAIYRPGQKLFFKIILTQKKNGKTVPFTNEYVYIELEDPNGNLVKSMELKPNEFGSISSKFSIPNNGITGEYSILVDECEDCESKFYDKADFDFEYDEHMISVEEYKRPKFEISFDAVKKSFKIGDSIFIKGSANSFSGTNISNSKVKYSITRNTSYANYNYSYQRRNHSVPRVIHGETLTNDQGDFTIAFKATEDSEFIKESLPIFNYTISTEITDSNGETRSKTKTVKVGYHTLNANISLSDKMDKNLNQSVLIETENLNNQFKPAKGNLKIYKLKSPKNPQRTRVWSEPDYQDISKEKFELFFPNEPYSNQQKQEKGALILDHNFDTNEKKSVDLSTLKSWKTGKYIVVLVIKDEGNNNINQERSFEVIDPKSNVVADNQLFTIDINKEVFYVGDTAKVRLGTAAKDLSVTLQTIRKNKIIDTKVILLDNNYKTVEIPITKYDSEGLVIHYHFTKYNGFFHRGKTISVSNEHENINIETITFRDKLQPNETQTWSFAIKNDQGDRIVAELLASMYDSSLDQFKSNNYSFTPFEKSYGDYYRNYQVSSENSFSSSSFSISNSLKDRIYFLDQNYDSFNWFGFNVHNSSYLKSKYKRILAQKIKNVRKGANITINGIVSDKDGALPGVSVVIKGTTTGTDTNFDGEYKIAVKKGDILMFSYLGYETKEAIITEQVIIDVELQEGGEALDEIVVTSFGRSITKNELNKSIEAILGSTPGVSISSGNGQPGQGDSIIIRGYASISDTSAPLFVVDGIVVEEDTYRKLYSGDIQNIDLLKDAVATSLYGNRATHGVVLVTTKSGWTKTNKELSAVKTRKNFQETAFFYPKLRTNKDGIVNFTFTIPEALTRWKLNLLAHTKELKSSTKVLQTITQKKLMVVPNAPRFLREGDQITFSTKISNLTQENLTGFIKLEFTNPITGKVIDVDLQNTNAIQNFSVRPKGNTNVSWSIIIPSSIQSVQYKVVAKAGEFSDGEQNVLPVLSNRTLVTETLPIWIKNNEAKTYTFKKLEENTSSTLKSHRLTLEMTSNPAWYAIQSLPYLMEYPYECAEQTFARYYANTIASFIANSNPKVKQVFDSWKSSEGLLSNLEKNQELKSLIIQETPWLRDAQSETEQKKRIGLLFDLNTMKNGQEKALNKLLDIQMSDGGFPWFKGSRNASVYITQHIVSGFGHLKKLNAVSIDKKTQRKIDESRRFLEEEFTLSYQNLLEHIKKTTKNKSDSIDYISKNHIGYSQVQFLYGHSFYDIPISNTIEDPLKYYLDQTKKYWKNFNLYGKAQIALIHHRKGDKQFAKNIIKSLKENSIVSGEFGMYWKENTVGYYYYQSPIETQALLIEAFSEIESNEETVENLKFWLLKHKQTNRWKTTKATTEAVYALLLNGQDWLAIDEMVDIKVGGKEINLEKLESSKTEARTGYFKTSWKNDEITSEMTKLTISKKDNGIAWGGFYWQYFEDLDKITSAESPLKLEKKLFLKVNTETGKELQEITENTTVSVGDLITVRIEVRSDRDMEFIHMKDMRASGVEPINVFSSYKWQDGLGYYESTRDASTNFFFDRIPKGIYVFEYDVRVNNAGDFSNGITTIQSMYAPEFSSHSEGVRIKVD